jgi:hypothetical protein
LSDARVSLLFAALALVLLSLGLRTSTWWTIAGGVGAATAATWWATRPPEG